MKNPAYEKATHDIWFPCLQPKPTALGGDGKTMPYESLGKKVDEILEFSWHSPKNKAELEAYLARRKSFDLDNLDRRLFHDSRTED